ncbi:MAG TPA: T9SS type A sorting domain-containing protein, partial [Bacteroidia bacterium]|nr:T9SS type A sorting domain-containing protein [Bacteroidia bacterium]
AAGIYVDGGKNVIVEQNESYNNDWGIEVGCEQPGDTTSNIKVRDNNLYRNGGGMQVGGYNGPVSTGRVINSTISNNTFFNNDTLNTGNGEVSLSYSENCSFFNNIFYGTNNTILSSGWNAGNSKNFQFDYNRYYSISGDSINASFAYGTFAYTGFASYKSGSGFDAHSIFANPSLTNTSPSTLDIDLLPSSTCINTAMPTFPADTSERDYNGNNRIIGGRIDIGAVEYQGPNEVQDIDEAGILKLYPNPVSSRVTMELATSNKYYTIRIINIYGETIFTATSKDQVLSIEMNRFAAGVYSVILNNRYSGKLIKE